MIKGVVVKRNKKIVFIFLITPTDDLIKKFSIQATEKDTLFFSTLPPDASDFSTFNYRGRFRHLIKVMERRASLSTDRYRPLCHATGFFYMKENLVFINLANFNSSLQNV